MSNVEQGLAQFKVELSQEWKMLQTHRWRQPKWMKIPRSMLDDLRWVKLSPSAAKAMITILLIAGETQDNSLPESELLYLRLRAAGQCLYRSKFSALINELIQCGFLTKTTPELQSYRVTDKISTPIADALGAQIVDKIPQETEKKEEKRLSEELRLETPPLSDNPPYSSEDVGIVGEVVEYIRAADTRAILGFFHTNEHRPALDAVTVSRILWDYAPPGLRPGREKLSGAVLTAWINSLADHPAAIDERVIHEAQREGDLRGMPQDMSWYYKNITVQ